jgi:hypothetical protein
MKHVFLPNVTISIDPILTRSVGVRRRRLDWPLCNPWLDVRVVSDVGGCSGLGIPRETHILRVNDQIARQSGILPLMYS